ncbi:MAG: hypothetical protein IJA45_08695 [Oscillospiraceae bacterium]|nr:hypothetical protein [Oscillospiraceae bacterium]
MEKTKPGVMVYFSVLEAFPLMTNAEKGILFEAILRFARDEQEPEFGEKRNLKMVWHLIRPGLVADNKRYYDVTARRKYAAYVRWSKKRGQIVRDYDEWVEHGGLEGERTYLDAEDALA